MPRRREGSIRESLEELKRLEAQYHGKPEATRITVLRLLKEDPKLGIENVSALVGYSKPTVKRWWRAYREGGMEAIIRLPGRRQASHDEELALLRQKLVAGDFNHVEDVRAWLEANRLRRQGRGRPRSEPLTERSEARKEMAGGMPFDEESEQSLGPLSGPRLLQFITSLPLSNDVTDWTSSLRMSLRTLLGDVDRVSISLNVQCDLINPEKYHPDIVITQSTYSTDPKAVNPLLEGTGRDEREHLNRLLDNLRRVKFPLANYHPPLSFVYYYAEHAYLGLIALWRERDKPTVSRQTIDAMEKLRGFFIYILSDMVARHQSARPIEQTFNMALSGMTLKAGLTMQERRIMILQLLGLSYEEVASTLNISLNTVRYHLRSIYSKTGAHSQAELFAKYFTPRYDPHQSSG